MTRAELQELRRLRRSIKDSQCRINRDKPKLLKLQTEAEEYISTIEDPYIALILRHRFIDGKRWRDVAFCLGGGNNEDSVRKACERYFLKQTE